MFLPELDALRGVLEGPAIYAAADRAIFRTRQLFGLCFSTSFLVGYCRGARRVAHAEHPGGLPRPARDGLGRAQGMGRGIEGGLRGVRNRPFSPRKPEARLGEGRAFSQAGSRFPQPGHRRSASQARSIASAGGRPCVCRVRSAAMAAATLVAPRPALSCRWSWVRQSRSRSSGIPSLSATRRRAASARSPRRIRKSMVPATAARLTASSVGTGAPPRVAARSSQSGVRPA